MNKRPRVLQLCAVDFTVKHFITPLVDFLTEQGCDVEIGCTPGQYFDTLRESGYQMLDLPVARSMNVFKHYGSYQKLVKHLQGEDYDVVHVHTPVASFVARQAATKAKVPVRFYTAHGFYFHERTPKVKRLAHIALERFFAKRCDLIFTVSDEDRRTAIKEGIAPSEKLHFIGQGIDTERFDPGRFDEGVRSEVRNEFNLPDDGVVVSITGRLVREKGYFELIEAANILKDQFPDLYFLAIGDVLESDYDGAKDEMLELVEQYGLKERFIFAGLRGDVERILSACDIFSLPSYREGMPVSILEAMAMGLPCVVTDIRGSREEVVEGESGFVVPVQNSELLAKWIGQLTSDRDLIKQMGQSARQRVLDIFQTRHYFERQWEMYQKFLEIE